MDLFCGAGGLSVGLEQAGFDVVAGVDNSILATEAYALNHSDVLLMIRDIRRVQPRDLLHRLEIGIGELDLLAGCPPCQGFSTMRTHHRSTSVADPRNGLVAQFARFVEELMPKTLLMENVPGLADDRRLTLLMGRLRKRGYNLSLAVLDAADFGVPQRRRRLVLIGGRDCEIQFANPAPEARTVREAFDGMPPAGFSGDPLHDHGEIRSKAVQALIRDIPKNGGSRTSLGPARQLACHVRSGGWYDVYSRMHWDRPSPTITSGCINPSKGRFLHPDADRAITLREAATLQSFPSDYQFPMRRGKYAVAALIGNALPPAFVASHAQQLERVLAAAR